MASTKEPFLYTNAQPSPVPLVYSDDGNASSQQQAEVELPSVASSSNYLGPSDFSNMKFVEKQQVKPEPRCLRILIVFIIFVVLFIVFFIVFPFLIANSDPSQPIPPVQPPHCYYSPAGRSAITYKFSFEDNLKKIIVNGPAVRLCF